MSDQEQTDRDNDDRALFADQALKRYQEITGSDDDTGIADLLADLMHLCDNHGKDFDTEVENARVHYLAELAGE